MLQPYGISLVGDAAGTVFTFVVFAATIKFAPRFAWGWLVVCGVLSAIGSIPIVVSAALFGEPFVGLYHLVWVIVSVWMARWAVRRFRSVPTAAIGGRDERI